MATKKSQKRTHPSPLSNLTFFVNHLTLTTFLINFCIMTLELVAGRIVAPFVGVSLYTWTAIIGIVLLGMTIGGYIGGNIADKNPTKATIGYLLVAASIAGVLTIFFTNYASPIIARSIPFFALKVLLVTSFFILPMIFLGTLSPLIIKIGISKRPKHAGRVIGNIYAAAAFGSIVGTYTTGFFLISLFGTRLIVIAVSGLLLLIACAFIGRGAIAALFRREKKLLLLGGFFLFVVIGAVFLKQICTKESNYYCIRVIDEPNGIRKLALNSLVHSMSDLSNPRRLEYEYDQLFAAFYDQFITRNEPTLFLGGGGYTIERYLVDKYKNPAATVVEIDPDVSAVAFSQFGMPRVSSIVSVNEDARMYLSTLPKEKKFALVFGDVFSDFSIPYHVTTREFNHMIHKHLAPGGYYIVNIIDVRSPRLFLKSFTKTLQKDFRYVYVYEPLIRGRQSAIRVTFVIVAGDAPLDEKKVLDSLAKIGSKTEFVLYKEKGLERLLGRKQTIPLLTDDYAPVDNMIADVH